MGETGIQSLHLARSIVMVGMMGSGKTTVGNAVAHALGVPFLDSDEEIERAAQMRVAEIFARDGERFFRARESEVILRLMTGPPAVISTGGGVFMSERNRQVIAEHGVAIWLKADPDLLWDRVKHRDTRPLLRTANPRETLREMLENRRPYYARARVWVEAGPDLTIDEMAQKVIARLREEGGLIEETKDA